MLSLLQFLRDGLTGWSVWAILGYTLIATHITIAGVTLYLHRSQAHRSLELHPLVAHFFRLWLWLSTGMQTKAWAAIHRKHHAKCETPDDPHSPQTRGLATVLTYGAELYRTEAANVQTLSKYGHGTPDDWLERQVYSRYPMLGIVLMLLIDVALMGFLGLTVWAIQMAWIPFFAAGVINGVGHALGYRNWESPDASTNISPWGVLIGGEELHNNHHAYPTSAKFSFKPYEFDIGWLYIRLLMAVRMAKVRALPARPRFVAAKPVIDTDTVQAVIQHRYDVMATYASSIRSAVLEEIQRLKQQHGDWQSLAEVRRTLQRDASSWSDASRRMIADQLARHESLRTLVEMRAELDSLWSRRAATLDQLTSQLQDWCARAEASGVRGLQDLSMRLRSYAI